MRVFRGILVVAGAGLVPLAVLALLGGEYRLGLSSLATGAATVLIATWAWGSPSPYPARQWAAVGLLAVGIAILMPLLAVAVFVAYALLAVLPSRYMLGRMSSLELELVGPDEVDPGAMAWVAELEAAGFRRVGGYRAVIPLFRKRVTASVLVGPDGDRFAVVTDRMSDVVSRYEGRWLVTTSSGLVPVPEHILRQLVVQGNPSELATAHEAGVELLAERGFTPDRFAADADVLEAARALEWDSIRFASDSKTKSALRIETRGKGGDPVLADDDRSRRRIDAWLTAPAPA